MAEFGTHFFIDFIQSAGFYKGASPKAWENRAKRGKEIKR